MFFFFLFSRLPGFKYIKYWKEKKNGISLARVRQKNLMKCDADINKDNKNNIEKKNNDNKMAREMEIFLEKKKTCKNLILSLQ